MQMRILFSYFWLDPAGLSPLAERRNHGFPAVVDPSQRKQGGTVQEAQSSVWGSSQYAEAWEAR